MPLLLNGTVVRLDDKSNEHSKFVNDCLKLIKDKAGKRIEIDLTDLHREQHIDEFVGPVRNAQINGVVRMPLVENVLRDGVNEEWRYYKKTTGFKKDGRTPKYEPRFIEIKGKTPFHGIKTDLELLFFMVFISPICEKSPLLKSKQNPNPENKSASYKVLMPEYDAGIEADFEKQKARAMNMIYNEMSEESLRSIARGTFNVPGTDTMGKNQLMKAVANSAFVNAQTLELFMIDSNVNPAVEIKDLINEAIEKNKITKNNQFGKPKWVYVTEEGKMGDVICQILKGGSEEMVRKELHDWFIKNPENLERLKGMLSRN